MKMLRRSRIGGAAFCLNCRGKKSNWGKLRGKTHCGEVQSQLFLAELEIIERKKTGNSTFPVFFFVMRDQFRCMLKIGKIESWSGFELFQPYFLLTISRDREESRDF